MEAGAGAGFLHASAAISHTARQSAAQLAPLDDLAAATPAVLVGGGEVVGGGWRSAVAECWVLVLHWPLRSRHRVWRI